MHSQPPVWKSQFPRFGLFPPRSGSNDEPITIGVLPGEGIGPSVTGAAVQVLNALADAFGFSINLIPGGAIGRQAERESGRALTEDVKRFCQEVFAAHGVVLAGAGGGRFVYDLRRELDLFCKLTPITPFRSLRNAGRFHADYLSRVQVLVVRDNLGGVYQGTWNQQVDGHGSVASHRFDYWEQQVTDILRLAARAAGQQAAPLSVIYKESGVPTISRLWRQCAERVCSDLAVPFEMLDVDYAAYKLVAEADSLGVVVAPNLFGDVLGDLAAGLLPSRGNSYSASFRHDGAAVYQTNHGAAHALAGKDSANPVGQILSVAMMLSESFALSAAAQHLVRAIESVWRAGYRTRDIAEPGCRVVGTNEMTERICGAVQEQATDSALIQHAPLS